MGGYTPGRAGTRRGTEQQQAPAIVRHHTPCANCGGRLVKCEHGNCRPCIVWLGIYTRTVEIARLLQAVQP